MLSNLETEKSKLLQIVLVGQPNLRDKLVGAGARAAAPADHGQLSPAAARRGRDRPLHQPPAAPRGARGAAGVPARRDRLDPRAQPRRAAHHQRDLRRRAGLRLRAKSAGCSTRRWSPKSSDELETTGVLPAVSVPCAAAPSRIRRGARPQVVRASRRGRRSEPPRSSCRRSPRGRRRESERAATVELEQREQAIRQREVEVAEQRRVLAEECRLMRAQRRRVTRQARPGPPPLSVRRTAASARRQPPKTRFDRSGRKLLGRASNGLCSEYLLHRSCVDGCVSGNAS